MAYESTRGSNDNLNPCTRQLHLRPAFTVLREDAVCSRGAEPSYHVTRGLVSGLSLTEIVLGLC